MMIWILLGALIIVATFFALTLTQVMSIEVRLRNLIVETELRLAKFYKVPLVPPGSKSSEDDESDSEPQGTRE